MSSSPTILYVRYLQLGGGHAQQAGPRVPLGHPVIPVVKAEVLDGGGQGPVEAQLGRRDGRKYLPFLDAESRACGIIRRWREFMVELQSCGWGSCGAEITGEVNVLGIVSLLPHQIRNQPCVILATI